MLLLVGLAHFPRLSEEVIRRALAADVRTVRSASRARQRPLADHHERRSCGLISVVPVANLTATGRQPVVAVREGMRVRSGTMTGHPLAMADRLPPPAGGGLVMHRAVREDVA